MKLRKRSPRSQEDDRSSNVDMQVDNNERMSDDSEHDIDSGPNDDNDPDLEQKRQRNRDAAARHRQRQQRRLDGLAKKEEILRQQVEEIQLEIDTIRSGRLKLPPPARDGFTDTILELASSVEALRTALTHQAQDCLQLTDELRQVAETVRTRRRRGGERQREGK